MAGTLQLANGTAPATPPSGTVYIYPKADKKIYVKDDTGTEFQLSSGAGISSTDDVAEGVTNLYFTVERAQDAVGTALTDTATVTLTYNDALNTIAANVVAASIANAQISASAAIAYSKLALTGNLVNTDISSVAAIALTKLDVLTASRAIVSNGSGILSPSSVTNTELGYLLGATSNIQTQLNNIPVITSTDSLSEGVTNLYFTTERAQDAVGATLTDTTTIDLSYNDGLNQITADVLAGSLSNSHVSPTANIAYSKLNLAGSIINADVSPTAAIAYSKLALTNSLVNADVASAAAIAVSKLATLTASRAIVSNGSGVLSPSTVTDTELSYVSGVTSSIQTQLNSISTTANYQLQDLVSDFIIPTGYNHVRADTELSGTTTMLLQGTAVLHLV